MSDQYIRWYPGDYQRDTGDLSLKEDGAYRRLLDHYYCNGPLPDDMERLFTITRAISNTDQEAVTFIVARFFTSNGTGVLTNKRADIELEYRAKYHESQKEKGKKGAKERWKNKAAVIAAVIAVGISAGIAESMAGSMAQKWPTNSISISSIKTLANQALI